MELTAEELAFLTPEERAGFEEEGGEGDETNNGDAVNTPGDDGNKGPGEGEEGGEAAAAKAAADAAAAAGATSTADQQAADAIAAAAAAEQQAQEPRHFQAGNVPLIRPGQIDDAEARVAELEGKLDQLAEQFDGGDLTTAEFLKQQRVITNDLNRIEQEKFRTELSRETVEARDQQSWEDKCGVFLNANPELGKSDLRLQAYDAVLRKVTGDPENSAKTDVQKLELARDIWAKELGIALEPKAKVEEAAPAAKPPAASATDRPMHPSLAGVPAAQVQSIDDGQFAGLDRLMETDPLRYEAELAKLPDAVRDQYLQFGA